MLKWNWLILYLLLCAPLTGCAILIPGECIKGSCKEGPGTYQFHNGNSYVGQWENRKLNGQGVFNFASGPFEGGHYEGEFLNNKINGHGTFYYANGDKYEGDFKANKIDGQGTFHYVNGNRY
ncbi:MAG: hypothetical protein OEL66_02050, partial [Desulfobulbaceae bacterium]|nr:hypothetical protein [Desulfobulbaceae bacterium]